MPRARLSLGSNLGDKRGTIARALELLAQGSVTVLARSHDYRTLPWGVTDQDWFVNCCVLIETGLRPRALLALCLTVEKKLGRVRAERWGPRLIDIDILTYDAIMLDEPGLTLPHPRLFERAFVLIPLLDIEPGLVIGSMSIAAALERIGTQGVERLDDIQSAKID